MHELSGTFLGIAMVMISARVTGDGKMCGFGGVSGALF